jgi:hypothetical protein
MSPQAGFLLQDQIIPRLKSAVPQVVNCVGSEDAAELVQDATAFAANMIQNAERAGKKVRRSACSRGARKARAVSAGNIAYYTIQHLKSGRRSTGSSVSDVMATGTQLKGRTRLTSLEEVASDDDLGEPLLLHDVLSRDEEDPGTRAARKLDWDEFWSGLSKRERSIIEFIIEGNNLRKAAHSLRLSSWAIKSSKKDLALKIVDFMGPQILTEIQHRPRWKQDLDAIREGMACREERRH